MVTIIQAESSNIDAMRELIHKYFTFYYKQFCTQNLIHTIINTRHTPLIINALIDDPNTLCIIAKDSKHHILGLLSAALEDNDTVFISRLFVDPTMQGKGIENRLLETVGQYFQKVSFIETNVAQHNKNAQKFFEQHGFIIHEEKTEKYPEGPIKLYVMRKSYHHKDQTHKK